MLRLSSILALAALSASATAQFSLVIPNGFATAEGGSSNAFPWGRGGTGLRIQCIYDTSHFTAQGVTFPIIITGLKWRPNTGVGLSASSYTAGCTVKLSTSPNDAMTPSTTFASNQGSDLTTCYSGVVSWAAQAAQTGPTPFGISVPFQNNFIYDPNIGDLNIECDLPIQTFSGSGPQLDVNASTGTCRMYLSTGYANGGANATGTINTSHGVVVEVNYIPAAGLYSGFRADVTSGGSPLTVNFTDLTFTNDPGGVTSWAWDFNGDGITDSTLRNPSYVYTTCGDFNVSLTTTDATHAPNTLTRTAYIRTDVISPSFTFSTIAPGVIQFTDTSTPAPTSWAWDLDGDSVVDSTAPNPVWVYQGVCATANVTLTVNRNCRGPYSTSQRLVLSPNTFATILTGGNGLSGVGAGNCFDINVTNPGGIVICAMQLAPYMATSTPGTALGCTVWVTDAPGGYLANHTNAAVWRQVATGTGTFLGGTSGAPIPVIMALSNPIYLPAGNFAMAVHMTTGSGVAYTTLTTAATYSNADFTITAGNGKSAPFNTTANALRGWNGVLHYSTVNNGSLAGNGYMGAGCTGTLGISRLSTTSQPAIGSTLNVGISNLPLSAAIMMTGFSNTSSPFGPLPLDITLFGAPGCQARVSPDVTLVVFGTGNAATWSLGIPNGTGLLGQKIYNQAFVLDPTSNALGAVLSDATAILIGL